MSVSRKTIHLISVFSVILVCHLNQAGVCANPIPTFSTRTDASACNKSVTKDNAEKEIQDFLSIESSSPSKGDTFYIQGWRWHTLSLIRDSDRLQKFANSLIQKGGQQNKSQEKLQSLNQAVDHVIDFNLKGLQRIENDIFFPWLRQKLINEDAVGADAKKAFRNVIDGVDCDRKRIDEIASKIRSEVKALDNHDSNSITSEMEKTFQNLAKLSNSLSEIATSVMEREDRLLVPAVVKVVPPREQKSFNNKVLRNLGIFESRCHLVGMHDAVYDSSYGNKVEQSMFVEQIPSIARMMIERWRSSLYEPKAGMLGEL